MKKIIIISIFLTIILAGFASAEVQELNNFRYAYFNNNGNFITTNNPIENVNYRGYVCTSNECETVTTASGTMFDGQERNTGSQTDDYVFTYPTNLINSHGYGIYIYKEGYIPYEVSANWAGTGTVGPYNNYLSKAESCRAPIEQFTVLNDVQPNVPLVIDIDASLDSTVFSPISNAGPLEYIPPELEEHYSVETEVTLTIYDWNDNIVHQEQKTVNIPYSSSQEVEFTWTPTISGNYYAEATTHVSDGKCLSSNDESTSKDFHVLSDEPRNACYTLLNNMGLSDQFPDAGETLTIYAEKTSNYANDNYVLTPVPTQTTAVIIKDSNGNTVFADSKNLPANDNPVDPSYFEYNWNIPDDASGDYTITFSGIANSSLCNGLPNYQENITVGTHIEPKPNQAPTLNDIPDQNLDEEETPPHNWIDLWSYAEDDESSDEELNFYLVSQSNPNLISCSIDNDRYINCNTPVQNQWGSSTITVEVSDGEASDRDSFTIFVNQVNDYPIISNIPNVEFDENTQYITPHSLDIYVDDPNYNDDELTWQVQNDNHTQVTINPNRTVTYSADQNWNGEETITFVVTNPEGLQDSDNVRVLVNDINDTPRITKDINQLPRRAVHMSNINFVNGDFLTPGSDLIISTVFKNNYGEDLEGVHITAIALGNAENPLGIRRRIGPFNVEEDGEIVKRLILPIPYDAQPGMYNIRLTLSNDDIRRVIAERTIIIR